MAYETRGGHRYYYSSVRDGDEVRRVYVPDPDEAQRLDAERQRDREDAERARSLSATTRQLALDIAVLQAYVTTLMTASLVSIGFHQHHGGEWRRRRDD